MADIWEKLITKHKEEIAELEAEVLPKGSVRDNQRIGSIKSLNKMLKYMESGKPEDKKPYVDPAQTSIPDHPADISVPDYKVKNYDIKDITKKP